MHLPERREKKKYFLLYPPTRNIICWKKKKKIRFCLCIFESDTVKTDCPAQIFRKMMKYLKIYYRLLVNLTSFKFFQEILKKKKISEKKISSENDQSTGHLQSFFYSLPPLNHKSEKKIW